MLRNGKFYDPDKMDGMEVIDENVVRHIGLTRLPSKNKTPFQLLLEKAGSNPSLLEGDKFNELANQLFLIQGLKKQKSCQLFSAKDEAIIDANNDNFRRFFESLLAKKILTFVLKSKRINEIKLLIDELTSFLTCEYEKHNHEFLRLWEEAKKGYEVKNDDLSLSFRVFRPDLINLIKEDHFKNHKDQIILKLYDLHYLTHPISHLKSYKERHPEGLVEIYDNNYKKRNPLFLPQNRGRLAAFGFNKGNPSYNLGIFRSSDRTPYDMRKPVLLSNTTRCADRLYMEHPKLARSNLNNWLNQCFSNGLNSCYVNGLSGSNLLEIRSILFFIITVTNKQYDCKVSKPDALFKENYALLKDYFLLITGLFVYFEGGHTFSEILGVLDIPEVAQCVNKTFHNKNGKNILSVHTLLIENKEMLQLIKESFIETIKFYSVNQVKNRIHNEIEKKPLIGLKLSI